MDELARRARVDAALAEFNAIRQEIADRSTTQNTLINLNLTAVAGLVSIIATQEVNESLLLLLCPICAALGMLWADHAQTIGDLGTYVNEELRKPLREVAGYAVLAWEEKSQDYRVERNVLLTYRLPLFLIFAGPPIAALLVTSLADPGIWDFDVLLIVYWVGGLVLTSYMSIVLGKMQFAAHQKRDWVTDAG
ncbi:MAG: hypothetical protein M3271_10510 [Actinomycetota bacterium]|nr:hypothetical protein [Actinomycetota bacterium]